MSANIDECSMLTTRVLAPNPGPMTLDGTNSYIVRHPSSYRIVIVDPGPRDSVHLSRLTRFGEIELVLLTHHHPDHAALASRIHEGTGAPVRAADHALCAGGAPLADGEVIHAGGTNIRVVSTPGHTADSVCFYLPDDRRREFTTRGSMLTGDTILGRGTTVIAPPDGSLRAYLFSLRRLAEFGALTALPAHGDRIDNLANRVAVYSAHRISRLRAVADAVAELDRAGVPLTVARITDRAYADVAPSARFAAEANVMAQLEYLAQTAIEGIDPLKAV